MWTLQKDSDQFYSDLYKYRVNFLFYLCGLISPNTALMWRRVLHQPSSCFKWKLPRIQSSTGLKLIGIIWCEQKEDWGAIWAKLDLKKKVLFWINSQCEQKKSSTPFPFLFVHFMIYIKRTEFGSFKGSTCENTLKSHNINELIFTKPLLVDIQSCRWCQYSNFQQSQCVFPEIWNYFFQLLSVYLDVFSWMVVCWASS